MDLSPYVDTLRHDLASAAEAGGEEARTVAERLGAALDSAARLALLEAISAATTEITREIAPGSVDVRLRGREPELVVTLPPSDVEDDTTSTAEAASSTPPVPETDDGGTARLTLRLPESLKPRIDQTATAEGLSVNAWLVRAIYQALAGPPRPPHAPFPPSVPTPPAPPGGPRVGKRITGWAR